MCSAFENRKKASELEWGSGADGAGGAGRSSLVFIGYISGVIGEEDERNSYFWKLPRKWRLGKTSGSQMFIENSSVYEER